MKVIIANAVDAASADMCCGACSQAAALSPPVAMSAFYLKGVSPPHVTLNQIFSGMMPYMLIVIVCMVFMYFWPGMTLWLPTYLYGN
jgi:TRAP-type mannitol/chloroaromatic compound transport system permease large subunit